MTDKQLLQRFVKSRGDEDFAAIVEKYGGLVLGTALRCTGRRALAEEVMQSVFLLLAQRAERMREPYNLASWLHRTAVLQSANMNRTEARERKKMSEFLQHSQDHHHAETEESWSEILPSLDKAIDALPSADRQVILLRFYEERSFRSMGEMTNRSEDACRMRVSRALKKLSDILRREGATVSVPVLGAGLSATLASEISPRLVASTSQAVAAVSTGGSIYPPIVSIMSPFKTTAAVSFCAFLLPIGIGVVEQHRTATGGSLDDSGAAANPTALSRAEGTATQASSVSKPIVGRSEREIARTIKKLGAHSNPLHAEADICEFLLGLSLEELPRALRVLPEKPGFHMGYGLGHALFTRWAEFDPIEALNKAEGLLNPRYRDGGTHGAVAAWVAQDPSSAQTFIQGLKEGSRRSNLEDMYWRGRADQDPQGAADEAMDLSQIEGRDRRLDDIMLHWRGRDAAGAIEWLRRLNDDARRDQWLENAIEQVAWSDPAQAFNHANEFFTGYHQQTVLAKVFASWAFSDPALALERMLEMPDAMRSPEMLKKFAVAIPSVDVARGIVAKVPVGDNRDNFIAGMAIGFDDGGRLSNEPGAGTVIGELIGLIADENIRNEATKRLASGWLKRDSETAAKWIRTSSDVPEQLRAKILSKGTE